MTHGSLLSERRVFDAYEERCRIPTAPSETLATDKEMDKEMEGRQRLSQKPVGHGYPAFTHGAPVIDTLRSPPQPNQTPQSPCLHLEAVRITCSRPLHLATSGRS